MNSISYDKLLKDLDILPSSSRLKDHNIAWLILQNIDASGNTEGLKKRVRKY